MKGLKLSSLTGELHKVHVRYEKKPVNAIRNKDEKLGLIGEQVLQHYGDTTPASFYTSYYKLPRKALTGFSFDETCKMRYSSIFTLHKTVDELFDRIARYEIIRKISSSMWRWGCGTGTWNEVVDTYENIRNFIFSDNPDFEVRPDHTTHYHQFGYSKFSRTFIDGVFAFLVYYKKKHVMTIGFSIMEGKKLLIQQIQLAKRSGNRFLYRLPNNRLEFVIDLFQKNFHGYDLYVVDGDDLSQKTTGDYQVALTFAKERCARNRAALKESMGKLGEGVSRYYLQRAEEDRREFEEKISHLQSDRARLVLFYKNAGRFTLGPESCKVNNLVHHCVNS